MSAYHSRAKRFWQTRQTPSWSWPLYHHYHHGNCRYMRSIVTQAAAMVENPASMTHYHGKAVGSLSYCANRWYSFSQRTANGGFALSHLEKFFTYSAKREWGNCPKGVGRWGLLGERAAHHSATNRAKRLICSPVGCSDRGKTVQKARFWSAHRDFQGVESREITSMTGGFRIKKRKYW